MTTFNKQNLTIIITLAISLLVRIYLSQFDGYKNDMFDFKLWSQSAYNIGITHFYRSVSSDYPPFYIYILWIVGDIYKFLSPTFDTGTTFFTILIKLPANIADIFTALLIFKILRKYSDFETAYFGMVIYVFNPAIIYNSAIWGQVDSINTFFMLLAIALMISDRLELAGISLAIAILTKPQSLVVLPFITIIMIKDLIYKNQGSLRFALLRFAEIFMISVFTFLILALPFYNDSVHGLIVELIKIYTSGYGQYAFNSVNAFNLWALLGLMKPDNTVILSLSYKIWGYILFGLLFVYVIISVATKDKSGNIKEDKSGNIKEDKSGNIKEDKSGNKSDVLIYFAGAVLLFGFFMFFTRIHERYLFPMFAPLVIVASLDKRLKYVYWILTFTFLFNLYSVLQAFNNSKLVPYEYVMTVSIVNLGMFVYMLHCFSRSSGGN